MSRNKDYANEVKELFYISVDKEYYFNNYDTFKPPNTEIKRTIVVGETHENDETHRILLKTYLKAQKDLRDYEFNKRHNFKEK